MAGPETDPDPPRRRRGRPQEARVSPQALAAARGGVQEGLEWLGREPESRASLLYRALRLLARAVVFGAFRFRATASGREHLPSGGYLLVAAVHRGWMDPFLIQHALPSEPRVWFLGSGPSAFTSRWREALLHRLGGMLPVWRGGVGIDQHVASARAVVRNGGVFVLMPEGGISGPPDRLAPFRFGSALICLRTGAPLVPFAIAGSAELYLGRRMATRVLPPTTARGAARRRLDRHAARGGLAGRARARPSADRTTRRAPRTGRGRALSRDARPAGPAATAARPHLAPAHPASR